MKTVLHLISGLNSGGAEHLVLELCKQSVRVGEYRMIVVSLSSANRIAYKFEEEGIEVFFLGINGMGGLLKGVQIFFKIIKENLADGLIIHAHMFHAGILACTSRLIRHSPEIVFTLHNNKVPKWRRRILLFLTKGLRNSETIFPGAEPRWYQRKDAVVIANGIDVSRYTISVPKPDLFTCIFIGRLEEQKNPLFLVKLVHDLKHRLRFRTVVVGEGPLMDKLQSEISTNNLSDYFEVLGYREDIPELLGRSHCLIVPSLWEGMPLVILEAGAMGIPVLTTASGNIPVLLDKQNGYVADLKEFGNLLEHIAKNYEKALHASELLRQQVLEKYNIKSCLRNYQKLYDSLIPQL